MTRFASCFMNHCDCTTANAAAAASSCPRFALFMDAAFAAASIFVICTLISLFGLVSVAVLVLVCLISVLGLIMTPRRSLGKANPVT